jgi:hypothetical protein
MSNQVFCRHCKHAIRPDGRSGWVHVEGGYNCRNEVNVLLSTHAEPPPPPAWPLNPIDR